MMATLYDVDVRTINEHIKKIYSDSELEEDSIIRNFQIVQTEGSRQVTRDTKSFEDGILIGEIVNVNAEERILTNGNIDPGKLKPITYDPVNSTYIGLGEKVGNAFKDGIALK